MIESIIQFATQFPHWFGTILLAAVPVTEARLAIPVATEVWLISPVNAFGLAMLGNILPFFPLYFGLEKLRLFFEKRWPWFGRLMTVQINKTKNRFEKNRSRFGAIGLFLYAALPLPFTGVWSATIAAVALKIPFRPAFIGIFLGMIADGIIVSILTVSADVFF